MIFPLKFGLSNAYLIIEERAILVDTGATGDANRIRKALSQHGIVETDLALIIHTHGHGDHVGSTADLRRSSGAPVAIHPDDLDMLTSGRNRQLNTPTRLEARLLAPFINTPFAPCQADILLESEVHLGDYGVDGQVLFTPGHTHGSITILLKNSEAIAGDICMGGTLGGRLHPAEPEWHYYYEDLTQAKESLQKLKNAKVRKLFVGHGGPLRFEAVYQKLLVK
jgi:hydroxyacylglutathione hydrolase